MKYWLEGNDKGFDLTFYSMRVPQYGMHVTWARFY